MGSKNMPPMERASRARALSHSTQVRQADRPRDGSQGQPEAQIFRQAHGDEVYSGSGQEHKFPSQGQNQI